MSKSIGLSLFLIALGIMFLLDNLGYVNISIRDLITTYWPVILIWIGAEKLYRDFRKD
jgi:lia operon protein LiaF|tara:strand:- start:3174 stop:3347 length:174 start_codon:yes stop_codon:yes gene_type:complete